MKPQTETHTAALPSQTYVQQDTPTQNRRTPCTYVWNTGHYYDRESALAAHRSGLSLKSNVEQRKTKDELCGPSYKSPQTSNTALGRMEVAQ